MVWNSEPLGTSTPSGSVMSWASGVESWRAKSLPNEYSEPTTPRPTVIIVFSSPSLPIRSAIAADPPAPTMLETRKVPPVTSPFSITSTAARPVWS